MATKTCATKGTGIQMHKKAVQFCKKQYIYFSDTTALASGFVPNLMKITQNVSRMGRGRKGKEHKI